MKRCLEKRNRLTRSGAAYHALPKCKYFDVLNFLTDKISNQETHSNISIQLLDVAGDNNNAAIDSNSTTPVSKSNSLFESDIPRKRQYSKSNNQSMSNRLDILTLDMLEKHQRGDSEQQQQEQQSEDSDLMFLKSLLPSLKALSKKSNRIARKKIQDIVFDLETEEMDFNG